MTRLPNHVARCLGRRNWTPQTETCPVRNTCRRYMASVLGDLGQGRRTAGNSPSYLWMCETSLHEQRMPVEVAPRAAHAGGGGAMSNAPTCRNCQHSTWVLTPRGQIKQKTAGECGHAKALKTSWAETPADCPALVGVRVDTRCIWPDTKVGKCPGFVRKPNV